MASTRAQLRRSLLVHLSFFLVIAAVPLTLVLTAHLSPPTLRWSIAYGPFWVWLVVAVRRSPRGIRIALLSWAAASIGAAALAGPVADLTVVPRVVWVIAEAGLAFHFVGRWLLERSRKPSATACAILSEVALVVAITSGITWFFARGSYEVSARLLESSDMLYLVNGSIGALVGVGVSVVVVRAWFHFEGEEAQHSAVLAA